MSRRLSRPVPPIFAPLPFRRHEHAHPSQHSPHHPTMELTCIEFTAHVERSKGHAQSDTRWDTSGNYRVEPTTPLLSSGGGGLFPLTRKIGLDNCRTTFPSSPLTLVCPSFFLEFPALVLTPPSLVSTIFPAKVCQEGKCGKFGKESGSRRTITKNPIILGRREDCNYRDYRIPEEANFSTLFNSCF